MAISGLNTNLKLICRLWENNLCFLDDNVGFNESSMADAQGTMSSSLAYSVELQACVTISVNRRNNSV